MVANLLMLLLLNQRVQGYLDVDKSEQMGDNSFVVQIWKGIMLKSGNYTYDAPQFKNFAQGFC